MVPLVPRRKADMHLPPIRLLFSRPLSFLVCYSVRGNSHRNQYNSVKVPWVTLSWNLLEISTCRLLAMPLIRRTHTTRSLSKAVPHVPHLGHLNYMLGDLDLVLRNDLSFGQSPEVQERPPSASCVDAELAIEATENCEAGGQWEPAVWVPIVLSVLNLLLETWLCWGVQVGKPIPYLTTNFTLMQVIFCLKNWTSNIPRRGNIMVRGNVIIYA